MTCPTLLFHRWTRDRSHGPPGQSEGSSSAEAVFSLRHRFISTDIGLPGAGMPLDGSIHISEGRARVDVYTNGPFAAFVVLVFGSLVLGSIVMAIRNPGWEQTTVTDIICAIAWWSFRRAKRAVPKVVADALTALGTIHAGKDMARLSSERGCHREETERAR